MKKLTCLLPVLLIVFALFPQEGTHTAAIIIKFKNGVSFDKQKIIFDKLEEFQPLSRKSVFTEFEATIGILTEKFPDEKIDKIINKLKKFDEVVYANPLLTNESGHCGGALGKFFVKLKSENDFEVMKKFAAETNTRILHEYKYLQNVYVLFADKNSKGNAKEMATYFRNSELFRYATPNMLHTLSVTSVNDPLFDRQWALLNEGTSIQDNGTPDADMDVDSAWTITTGSPFIKVAVLDSGVDTLHEDLVDNLLPGFDAFDTTKGYPYLTFQEDGHGTCCAGIIAAAGNNNIGSVGVAYNCKIIPVRIFFYIDILGPVMPYSTTQAGADGLNWAAYDAKADVMSNSWGLPDDQIAQFGFDTAFGNDALIQAYLTGRSGKGVPMLFSAGNDPDPFTIWPSSRPQTIAVAATSMCDELKSSSDCSPENWGSNHGKDLDISGPGVRITTSDMTGTNGFSSNDYNFAFNGTSAACPNVAGVMALILSVDSNYKVGTARKILESSCEKVGGYAYDSVKTHGTWSMELGYGRVNAYNAVQLAQLMIGVDESEVKSLEFSVFPNPNEGKFELRIANYELQLKKAELKIFTLLGEPVYHQHISMSANQLIDLSSHPKGVYFAVLQTEKGVISKKIVLQ
ncbi:MAG: hypothetical protein COA57_01875 [Flavobacteriales bacterium]|nr:MAG: hypothetical protein COA57_01875 [Flavobacteriales bacterium]